MVFTYTFLHTRKWLYYSTHAYSSSIVVGIVVKLMGGKKGRLQHKYLSSFSAVLTSFDRKSFTFYCLHNILLLVSCTSTFN